MSDWSFGLTEAITIAGVGASSVFSFLLWQASKESAAAARDSAAAAAASTHLAEKSDLNNLEKTKAMSMQLKIDLRKQALNAQILVMDIFTRNLSVIRVEDREKRRIKIDAYHLAEYFSDEERKLINRAWENLDMHFFNHWLPTSDGGSLSRKNYSDKSFPEEEFQKIASEFENLRDKLKVDF